jgi:hypothetical protein
MMVMIVLIVIMMKKMILTKMIEEASSFFYYIIYLNQVVKIELRNPPPQVNFLEWDGMIRMVFNRKHKTLHAILTVKSILIILEQNYKTYLSLHNTNNNNSSSCSSSSSSSSSHLKS